MKFSDDVTEIMPALIAAQAEFSGVEKGGENKFDKYSYAKLEDYIKAASPVLVKHDLAIVTGSNGSQLIEGRQSKDGTPQHAYAVSIFLRLVHKSGQWIEVESIGEGQDRGDKSTYKALTGARKYGVAMLLGLITTDDPEATQDTSRKQTSDTATSTTANELF